MVRTEEECPTSTQETTPHHWQRDSCFTSSSFSSSLSSLSSTPPITKSIEERTQNKQSRIVVWLSVCMNAETHVCVRTEEGGHTARKRQCMWITEVMIFRVSGDDSPSVSMEIPLSLCLQLCVAHSLSASSWHRDSKKRRGGGKRTKNERKENKRNKKQNENRQECERNRWKLKLNKPKDNLIK